MNQPAQKTEIFTFCDELLPTEITKKLYDDNKLIIDYKQYYLYEKCLCEIMETNKPKNVIDLNNDDDKLYEKCLNEIKEQKIKKIYLDNKMSEETKRLFTFGLNQNINDNYNNKSTLKSHLNRLPVKVIKRIIRNNNVRGYSKSKKDEIIEIILKSNIPNILTPLEVMELYDEHFIDRSNQSSLIRKESAELKSRKNRLIDGMKKMNKMYNNTAIKKKKFKTKEEAKKYNNDFFDLRDDVKKMMDKTYDDVFDFKKNSVNVVKENELKQLNKDYNDNVKNFSKRLTRQIKENNK